MSVELHCHSLFSVDGWATPEELVESRAAEGIRAMSITDHNTIEGLERARVRAGELGIRFLDGIEFDAMWQGTEYHLLAFGFNPDDSALRELCVRQFAQYEINFARILPVLQRRYGLTREELLAGLPGRYRTHPAPVLNKWFARGYLKDKGLVKELGNGKDEMGEAVAEAEAGVARPWAWAKLDEVLEVVHDAGGILLLAHPAGFARGNLRGQLDLIHELMAVGLDGFELYHPANTREPHFAELEAEARRLGCAVSGGSDTHRDPSRTLQAPTGFSCPDWVLETLDAALQRRKR